MITEDRIGDENHTMILTEIKLRNMNILQLKKYYLLVKVE